MTKAKAVHNLIISIIDQLGAIEALLGDGKQEPSLDYIVLEANEIIKLVIKYEKQIG